MHKYIITGGPGAGKTNVIEALKIMGYHCADEVSRRMIIRQVEKESNCLPWTDLTSFADLVLEEMIISVHKATPAEEPTFYDRGIPDMMGYLKAAGLPVKAAYYEALEQSNYHKTVFILPPWPEIYINDSERWQTYDEAEALYVSIAGTYESFGFKLIEVPKLTVTQRANYIINYINRI